MIKLIKNFSINELDGLLFEACFKGHIPRINELINMGADVNSKLNGTPLHIASSAGHLKAVELLIKRGAHINSTNNLFHTPLNMAVINNHYDIFNYIFINGGREYEHLLLYQAASNGNIQMITRIIECGSEYYHLLNKRVGNDYCIPLHKAAYYNHIEAVKFLVDKGSYLYSRNNKDHTPLDLAYLMGHSEIVKYLEQIMKNKKKKIFDDFRHSLY